MASPIQVVLEAANFVHAFEHPPGGSRKDVFEGRDEEFRTHRDTLAQHVRHLADNARVFRQSRVAVASVDLAVDALAKSNRPSAGLLNPDRLVPVGTGAGGELLVQTTAEALRDLASRIADAPVDLVRRERVDKKTGEVKTTWEPTRARCDVGAIHAIHLWDAERRLRLSQERMERWFEQNDVPRGLIVPLFTYRGLQATDEVARHEHLIRQLHDIGCHATLERSGEEPHAQELLIVQLQLPTESPTQWLQRLRVALPMLREHPAVRNILAPPRLAAAHRPAPLVLGGTPTLPVRAPNVAYPSVAVIDGGLGKALGDWVRHVDAVIDPAHGDATHGSFIGGLLTAGQYLNGASVVSETDGCDLSDLCILPKETPPRFSQYFQTPAAFFDELDAAVGRAKAQLGTRVFNFSLNSDSPTVTDEYSYDSQRLDQIAQKHDVVFVISAGNLDDRGWRPEWPADDTAALQILARAAGSDFLTPPADSLANVSVAALNAPGPAGHLASVPAAYSRRGPSRFGGVKPDVAHIGGCGTESGQDTGLWSISPAGLLVSEAGTSYAAPLVAKTMAWYPTLIEGYVSRELMLALLVHQATTPAPMQSELLEPLARDLCGFGIPNSARASIEGEPHVGTLMFEARIPRRQRLTFEFPWPASLVTGGKCRGRGRLTLVARPVLDYKAGQEVVRTQLDAHVVQLGTNGKPKGGHFSVQHVPPALRGRVKVKENELIRHLLKWCPIKTYTFESPRGVGTTSRWRFTVEALERTPGEIPDEGIPFVAILSLEDMQKQAPIFDELRRELVRNGVRLEDIRVAARVRART